MKDLRLLLPAVLFFCVASCAEPKMERLINRELKAASLQYKQLDMELPDSLLPRSWDAASSELITSGPEWWCSGFFPGSLWMLYQETGDEVLREAAVRRNELLRQLQFNRGTHDLGFMLYNSFGKGYAVSASE
ncbi:MAG: glucuronyl hydrolase, partial [Bacteroidota bacterium]